MSPFNEVKQMADEKFISVTLTEPAANNLLDAVPKLGELLSPDDVDELESALTKALGRPATPRAPAPVTGVS